MPGDQHPNSEHSVSGWRRRVRGPGRSGGLGGDADCLRSARCSGWEAWRVQAASAARRVRWASLAVNREGLEGDRPAPAPWRQCRQFCPLQKLSGTAVEGESGRGWTASSGHGVQDGGKAVKSRGNVEISAGVPSRGGGGSSGRRVGLKCRGFEFMVLVAREALPMRTAAVGDRVRTELETGLTRGWSWCGDVAGAKRTRSAHGLFAIQAAYADAPPRRRGEHRPRTVTKACRHRPTRVSVRRASGRRSGHPG